VILGVISDTHGLLRPEAIQALRGVDRIIHAGDVGGPEVLAALAAIAPVDAVRGNNDRGPWAAALPQTQLIDAAGSLVYVIHDVGELDLDPAAAGIRVIVAGHSHRPSQRERDGVLWFNPGSAGPRRFKLPISLGRLVLEPGAVRAELITLAL
jgi:putative phosphoesterase